MQVSPAVLSGPFFRERPYSEVYPTSAYQSEAIENEESVIKLEELEANSKDASFKSRVVGIVKRSDLIKQPNGNYLINKRLYEKFDKPHGIKNLPKGFESQYFLPFGTGVALSEDLILTAGHNTQNGSKDICVVQYELEGMQLSHARVYEIDKYIHIRLRDKQKDQEHNDPEIYASNLLAGDWAIIKLKRTLQQVTGLLKVAEKITDEEYKEGAATITLGHPLGLPVKKSSGKIEKVLNKHIVRYEAQTLGGMSGGPVFSSKTNKLIGLHIRGNINHKFNNLGEVSFSVIHPINPKIIEIGIYGTFFQSIVPIMDKITKLGLFKTPTLLPKQAASEDEEKSRNDLNTRLPFTTVSVNSVRINEKPKIERMENSKLSPTTTIQTTIQTPLIPYMINPEPSRITKCCKGFWDFFCCIERCKGEPKDDILNFCNECCDLCCCNENSLSKRCWESCWDEEEGFLWGLCCCPKGCLGASTWWIWQNCYVDCLDKIGCFDRCPKVVLFYCGCFPCCYDEEGTSLGNCCDPCCKSNFDLN